MREDRKDILFVLYMLIVLVMAIVYFSIPERSSFFDYQFKWWGQMWNIIRSHI